MSEPMALVGMVPMEVNKQAANNDGNADPSKWGWKPKVQSTERLKDVFMSGNLTSRQTFTNQVDHGEFM